jgi:hypothetical protein
MEGYIDTNIIKKNGIPKQITVSNLFSIPERGWFGSQFRDDYSQIVGAKII